MNSEDVNVEDIYELSPAQEGMLFHTLYAPNSGIYVTQFEQPLDEVAHSVFEQCWQRIMDRHAVLRTSIHWEGLEKPLQVAHRRVELPLERHDWRGLTRAQQEQRLMAHLTNDRKRGFDPSQAPLMRLTLIRRGDDDYYLIWTYHHILLDGWSLSLLAEEAMTSYEAFRRGEDLELACLSFEDPPAKGLIGWRIATFQADGCWCISFSYWGAMGLPVQARRELALPSRTRGAHRQAGRNQASRCGLLRDSSGRRG